MSSAVSKSTLPVGGCQHTDDATSSSVSVLNLQLSLNAADRACQPQVVLVPETLPQDFVDFGDVSERQDELVEKKDDSSVSCTQAAHTVASVEYDGHIADNIACSTKHTVIRSPEKTGSSSPVFNRPCQFAAPVSVNRSPSLFDDDEEKRLHQRNIVKSLFMNSEKNFAAMNNSYTDVLQPSPSVLSSKLVVDASAHPENQQKKYKTNVDENLQSTVEERGGLQAVTTVKCKDSCDFAVKMKFTDVPSSSSDEQPDELDVQGNAADDTFCNAQTLDVNRDNHGAVERNKSIARSVDAQNELLSAVVKMSPHDTDSASHATCEPLDCRQPMPKKRRCEVVNSNVVVYASPHAVNIIENVENNGKLFAVTTSNGIMFKDCVYLLPH